MDRVYVKKTQQQYHKNSTPMEPTRIKEKRHVQEHMEKSSGAGNGGGTSHMEHDGEWRQQLKIACNGGNSLVADA